MDWKEVERLNIRTSDEELYSKLKSLNYTDEVLVKGKKRNLSHIMKSVNKKDKMLESTNFGDRTIIRRLKPVRFNIRKIRR